MSQPTDYGDGPAPGDDSPDLYRQWLERMRSERTEELMADAITLPIKRMLADANVVDSLQWPEGPQAELVSDMACHIAALADELRKAAEACAVAMNHLDTYGTVTGGHDREMESQAAAFEALGRFARPCGHKFISVYGENRPDAN